MHYIIEKFLSDIHALHQLEPQNLPENVLHVMVKMQPAELFKTCSQLAVLLNNIPSKNITITLSEEEIASLAEAYLKGIVKRFKNTPKTAL